MKMNRNNKVTNFCLRWSISKKKYLKSYNYLIECLTWRLRSWEQPLIESLISRRGCLLAKTMERLAVLPIVQTTRVDDLTHSI
jgi:hypothetical protein